MSRVNLVINWTSADIKDQIRDLTLEAPETKENQEAKNDNIKSLIKRRRSVKPKIIDKTNELGTISENIDNLSTTTSFPRCTNHFEFAPTTNAKTSNNKLDQADRITYSEMITILDTHEYKNKQAIKELNMSYREEFPNWLEHMKYGFNILLFGVGSKKTLIERFVKNYLSNYHYVKIFGYHPDLSIKNLLKKVILEILHITDTIKTFEEQIDLIKKNLKFPLFIIIHNIDGTCLRDPEIQTYLAEMATIEHIHFIASIDHINSGLLWDQKQFLSFKWIYYDVSTFKAYNEEIAFENSLMCAQTGNVQLSSLIHVLKSLTQNAKNIFLIVAHHVLDAENTKKNMSFSKLYYECREKFYVSNELTLRAQLTEFIDHKMIKIKTETDGYETIYLLIDDNNLKLYLEELKDKI